MAKTTVKEKPAEQEKVADQPESKGQLAHFNPARLPYGGDFLERDYGVNKGQWKVLVDAIYPSAKSEEAVVLALAYCKQRNLDPFKRPVHIVPMWDTKKGAYIETVWPSISELRTTASRTKNYAGIDEAVFGPMIKKTFVGETYVDRQKREVEIEVEFAEWCRMTVYRIVGNIRCAFVGPKVLWEESYATIGKTDLPNVMWQQRTIGQLEKCAEAAALRRAFPEELGNEYTAEEMAGRKIENLRPDVEVLSTSSKRDEGPPKRSEVTGNNVAATDVDKMKDADPAKAKEAVTEGEFTEKDGTAHDADGVVRETGSHVSGDPVDDMADAGAGSMDDEPAKPTPPKPRAHVIDFTGLSFSEATAKYIEMLQTSVDTPDVYRFGDLNKGSVDKIFQRYKAGGDEIRRATEGMIAKLRPKNVDNRINRDDRITSGPQTKTDYGPPKRAATAASSAPTVDPEVILKRIKEVLDLVEDPNDLEATWEDTCGPLFDQLLFPADKMAAQDLHKKTEKRLGID